MKRILTALVILLVLAGLALAQGDNPTPVPTSTATLQVSPESIVTATPGPSPTAVVIDPFLNISIPPPIEIELPEEWLFGYFAHVYEELDGTIATIPYAIYQGPVLGMLNNGIETEAQGTIVILWGYDTVVNEFTVNQTGINPMLDGQRMLRLVMFDNRCVIGMAPQKQYNLGEQLAVGTQFSVVDCPNDEPDTRGWFASTNVDTVNFSVYAFADPIQPVNSPFEFELQSILDTIEFTVAERFVQPEDLQATRDAITLTLTPIATPDQ